MFNFLRGSGKPSPSKRSSPKKQPPEGQSEYFAFRKVSIEDIHSVVLPRTINTHTKEQRSIKWVDAIERQTCLQSTRANGFLAHRAHDLYDGVQKDRIHQVLLFKLPSPQCYCFDLTHIAGKLNVFFLPCAAIIAFVAVYTVFTQTTNRHTAQRDSRRTECVSHTH